MPPRLDTLAKGHELPPSAFELSPEWVREYIAAVEDEAIGLLGPELVPPNCFWAANCGSVCSGLPSPPASA